MATWNSFPSPPAPRSPEVQEPLGPNPSYDDVLDVAVQYSFPCSDPIAVEEICTPEGRTLHPERDEGGPKGPGMTPGHGGSVALGDGS